MRKLWPIIYALGILLSLDMGYDLLRSDVTARTDMGWPFIAIFFVAAFLFPLIALAPSRSYAGPMRRPSWYRHPFGWHTDPLQALRVSIVATALVAFGAAGALPNTDHKGVMLICSLAALAVGFFIGERFAYFIYRKRILA
jgi:hypothetical protein